jgi:F0F1-type ATP synthase assembly protein I
VSEDERGWAEHLRFAHVGIQFALIFGFCFYGGHLLDQSQKTKPLYTLIGVFLGFGVAFYHLYRTVVKWEEIGQPSELPRQSKDDDSKSL